MVAGVDALLAAAKHEDIALPAAASESYEDDSDGSLPFWLPLLGSIPLLLHHSSVSAGGGGIAVVIVRSVRRGMLVLPKSQYAPCSRKGRWRRSASAAWTTTSGSARRVRTISRCAIRNG